MEIWNFQINIKLNKIYILFLGEDCHSVCSGSMYEEYDPFDYLHSGSAGGSVSEPIYATITRKEKSPASPPPIPPRSTYSTLDRPKKNWSSKKTRLYENLKLNKQKTTLVDCDLQGFYSLVKSLRSKFKYDDSETNSGMVISPRMQSSYKEKTSIKICVYPQMEISGKSENANSPIIFTSDGE